MWVARDKNGELHLFAKSLPYRYDNCYWEDEMDFETNKVRINKSLFSELTWDDEPIKVELCQLFNSYEHNMLNQLEKAYNTADDGSNPFNNDAGGASFCSDIKNMITPILQKIKKDIDIINK